MKSIQVTIGILALSIFTISCSKDDDPLPAKALFPEENFLQGYLTTSNFNQQVSSQNTSEYYNYGIAFKPKVNGTINSIVIKLPSSDGGVVVRIWKVSTQVLLKTIPVVVATNNLEVTIPIDKVPLLKDEEYIVTMKVNSCFVRKRTNGSSVTYPIEIDNIKITNVIDTSINSYPGNNSRLNYYFGDISFNFQQTE